MDAYEAYWFDVPHLWEGVPELIWDQCRRVLPRPPRPRRRRCLRKGGRPRLPDRLVFSGLLWLVVTGLPWRQLPNRFGSDRTVRRRLRHWAAAGRLERLFRAYLDAVDEKEVRRWSVVFEGARGRRHLYWLFLLEWVHRYHHRAEALALEPRRG